MRVRIFVGGVCLALFALAAPAVAGGNSHAVCSGFTRGTELAIFDSCFQGVAHLADPGTTVRVVNQGFVTHDITAVDGTFASGPIEPGATFRIATDERGAIPFYCTLHGTPDGAGMAGVLIVGTTTLRPARAALASARDPATPATAAPSTDDTGAIVFLAVAALVVAVLALTAAVDLRLRRHERTDTP